MNETTTKINLGGGNTKMEGYINIDILNFKEVDIVHDLSKGIPIEENSVDEIFSSHFLEHVEDMIFVMKEIYRVCKPGAIIKIKVPYFSSIGAFKDPTHKSFYTNKTFDYFDKLKTGVSIPNYELEVNFRVEKIQYIWSKKWLRFLPFKETFFMNYFWNIAKTMYVELEVIK